MTCSVRLAHRQCGGAGIGPGVCRAEAFNRRGAQHPNLSFSPFHQRNASHLSCRTLWERHPAVKNGVDAKYDDSDADILLLVTSPAVTVERKNRMRMDGVGGIQSGS
jgi:hypothetical protein